MIYFLQSVPKLYTTIIHDHMMSLVRIQYNSVNFQMTNFALTMYI